MPGVGTRAGHAGASARCAPRPSATPRGAIGAHEGARARGAGARARARRSPRRARASPGGSPRRCGGSGWPRAPAGRAAREPRSPMIAFGSVDHRARGLPALRRAGHPARRRAGLRGATPSPPSGRSAAATTCCSTRRGARDDLEALVLVHPHAEIADPDFCAAGARGAARSRGGGRRAASGATGRPQHRLVGGRGELRAGRPPLPRARRRRAAGYAWARPGAPLGEVDAVDGFLLVLSPWAVRNVRFDESLTHGPRLRPRLLPRRSARPGRKVVTADLRAIHHHSLELLAGRPRALGRGPHPGGREVGRPLARRERRAGGLEAPRPPRRGRARGGAGDRLLATRSRLGRARCWRWSARMERDDRQPVLAAHRAAARGSTGAPRRAALRRVVERAADLVLRDHGLLGRDAGALAQPRQALGDRERARLEQPPQHGLLARRGARARAHSSTSRAWPCARWWTRLASSRSSIGLRSHGSRIRGELARPRRVLRARPRRSRRTRARRRAAAARGPPTKSSTAVSTPLRGRPRAPPSAGRAARPGARPGLAREDARRAARDRLAVLLGDQLGREVVVAAPVGPADVVEEQQRQLGAGRALADQPQLLADRVVVVVAVDDHRVRQLRDAPAAPRGWSRGSARARGARARAPPGRPAARGRRPPPARPAGSAQSTSTRVRSPANAPTSTIDRTPAASRQGSMSSADCAIDVPQRSGSFRYGSEGTRRRPGRTRPGRPSRRRTSSRSRSAGWASTGSEPVWCRNSSSKNSASPGSKIGRMIGASPAASSALRWDTW